MIEITDRITRRQLSNFRKYLNILAEQALDITPNNLNKMAGNLSLMLEYWKEFKLLQPEYAPTLETCNLENWLNNLDGYYGAITIQNFGNALQGAKRECDNLVAQIKPPLS